jgi:hypothetical protein
MIVLFCRTSHAKCPSPDPIPREHPRPDTTFRRSLCVPDPIFFKGTEKEAIGDGTQ